ncbi:hypothetical protein E2320_013968 [Naja naja]|nr:hypothetical protein E2320_013968 [Naja naja]
MDEDYKQINPGTRVLSLGISADLIPLTQFVRRSESRLEPIILNYGTTAGRITHGAHICHAQSTTAGASTEILTEQEKRAL